MSTVVTETRGQLGLITLNRPEVLNALDLNMIKALQAGLERMAEDPDIKTVAITSASPKAFCAGGDVRAAVTATLEQGADFFRHEYRLNYFIATYPKPLMAIIDGIAMGGGLGISVHAKHCLVTENAVLAMPEMAIGLFPDVGGGAFLNRHSLDLGLWIALTGARLNAADAVYAQLASACLPRANIGPLLAALAAGSRVEDFTAPAPPSALAQQDTTLHLDRLGGSPTSIRITLKHLADSHGQSLKSVLENEYRLACACLRGHDFKEGVRAMLIEKDRQPHWQPATLAEVTTEMVAAHWDLPVGGGLFDGLT